MSKINWKAVEAWRNELRSGKYEQTIEMLKSKNGYCCLGVFCEAVAKIKPAATDNFDKFLYKFGEDTELLPASAMVELGINISPPRATRS